MSRVRGIWFLAGMAILVAANWTIYRADIDVSPIDPKFRALTEDAQTGESARQADGIADVSAILERPLFRKDRRRFVPAPIQPVPVEAAILTSPTPSPETPPMPETLPVLLGVSIGADISTALFRAEGEQARWHVKGEILAGWAVVSIEKDRVLLERDGQKKGILLYPPSESSRNSSDAQ